MKKKFLIEILFEMPHKQGVLDDLATILKKGIIAIVNKSVTDTPTVTIKTVKLRPSRSPKESLLKENVKNTDEG